MGLFDRINRAWSGADFWDKKENQKQRQQFAAQDKRKKRLEEEQARTQAPNIAVQRPQDNITPDKPAFDFTRLKTPTNKVQVPQLQEYDAQALDNVGVKKPQQSLLNKVRDQVDANTEADKYRRAREQTQQVTKELSGQGVDKTKALEIAAKQAKANINTPETNTLQSNIDIANRSRRAVGSFFTGGLTGAVKGLVETPKIIAETPNSRVLARLLAAKLSGNEEAMKNAAKDAQTETIGKDLRNPWFVAPVVPPMLRGGLAVGGKIYEKETAPVAKALTESELRADKQAKEAAPWAPGYVKPTTKVLSNLLPVDAAVTGLVGLSRARNVSKTLKEGEAAVGSGGTIGIPPRKISVGESINVVDEGGGAVNVPVRNTTPEGPIIREIGGDAPNVTQMPTPQQAAEQKALDEFANQPFGRPDDRIEGVTARTPEEDMVRLGEPSGVTRIEIDTERAMLDDALKNGEINKTQHKQANKALDETPASDAPLPPGRKIEVKQVDSLPVQDRTVVPTDSPEVPGTVRVSTQKSPVAEKTQAVADQPPVKAPKGVVDGDGGRYMKDGGYVAPDGRTFDANGSYKGQVKTMYEPQAETPSAKLPKVGSTMPDGTVVTKRDVARMKENNKNAKKYARQQEQTSETLGRIEAADPRTRAVSEDGFAPTGEFKVGKKGNAYEAGSRQAEAEAGAQEMANRPVSDLLEEISQKGQTNQADVRKIKEALKRLKDMDGEHYRQNPEYNILDQYLKKGGSDAARQMGLIERVQRRTATSDALTARWDRKIGNALDDPTKIQAEDLKAIQTANDEFTVARDNARRAEEAFRADDSVANERLYKQALDAEKTTSTRAIDTELTIAKKLLKKEKNPTARKVIDELETEANIKMMDYVTASQLSGPATGFRNWFGTEAAGLENRILSNTRARVSRAIFGEDGNVGGFDRAGARAGRKEGFGKMLTDYKRRQDYAGKNPLQHAKNIGTTMNTAGESSMGSQVQAKLGAYYKRQLKDQGYSGDQLKRRTEFMRRTDPDARGEVYQDAVMKASGLTGIFGKARKVEAVASEAITKGLESSQLVSSVWAGRLGRGISRVALGYPTATGNFLWQSGKRATVGLPSLAETGIHLAKGDKVSAARAFDNFMKEAGSGSAMLGLGVALGSAGMVSGSYPESPEERARWEREGISENSIKIGNDWRPIPQGLGMFGLPIMVGAAFGREGDSNESVKEMFKPENITKLMPQDQVAGLLELISGNGTESQVKNFVASTIRSVTPLGSLFNQVAKGIDPTKNDTTSKDFWNNVFDQVVTGIPGQNLFTDIPDKKDKDGNVITNPGFMGVMTGASSAVQTQGEERSTEINQKIDTTVKTLKDTGVFNDPNLKDVLDGEAVGLYNRASKGDKLDESEIKALKKALTKGVSSKAGEDTAYLEKEQYDTNLTVLKLKRELMAADKTTKPSTLKDIDLAITRGGIYKDNKVPYDMINEYKETSQQDWRNMGNPEHDDYDPDMYQKLWDIDKLMTDKKVSYRKGDPEKAKFKAEEAGKGKGKGSGSGRRGGSGSGGSEFGTIKDMGPRVKEYDSMAMSGGNVPVIGVKRPNIVHKITSSR